MTQPHSRIYRQSSALIMAFFVGAISLSQEIIWVRILSFSSAGAPTTFAHTLGSFLIGIAIGAMIGRRVCNYQRFSFMVSMDVSALFVLFLHIVTPCS